VAAAMAAAMAAAKTAAKTAAEAATNTAAATEASAWYCGTAAARLASCCRCHPPCPPLHVGQARQAKVVAIVFVVAVHIFRLVGVPVVVGIGQKALIVPRVRLGRAVFWGWRAVAVGGGVLLVGGGRRSWPPRGRARYVSGPTEDQQTRRVKTQTMHPPSRAINLQRIKLEDVGVRVGCADNDAGVAPAAAIGARLGSYVAMRRSPKGRCGTAKVSVIG
jgi:hypothetical protein